MKRALIMIRISSVAVSILSICVITWIINVYCNESNSVTWLLAEMERELSRCMWFRYTATKKREKLFVSRFFFLAAEKWPCEFLAADWIKNDFIERSRQALNSPFHIYVYPSDEYSDELNYYHFCWRIRTIRNDCQRCRSECVKSNSYSHSMRAEMERMARNVEEYKLPNSIICYYAVHSVLSSRRKWSRVRRIHKYVVQIRRCSVRIQVNLTKFISSSDVRLNVVCVWQLSISDSDFSQQQSCIRNALPFRSLVNVKIVVEIACDTIMWFSINVNSFWWWSSVFSNENAVPLVKR